VTVEPSPKLRIRNATVPGRWRIMFLDPTPLSPEWRAKHLKKDQPSPISSKLPTLIQPPVYQEILALGPRR
jgi:hypothetical protein